MTMGGLHPIRAYDVQVIVVCPAENRVNFSVQANFF